MRLAHEDTQCVAEHPAGLAHRPDERRSHLERHAGRYPGRPASIGWRRVSTLRGTWPREWSYTRRYATFPRRGDLWVLAGQSNSAGYGCGPIYDPPELGVHLYRNSEQWALATHPLNESTDTRHAVNRENANSGHSPYLHFARLLKQELHHRLALFRQRWVVCAGPLEPDRDEVGSALHNMVHCVQRAGGAVKGILWYQGESDTDSDICNTYARRFESGRVRLARGIG